MRDGNLGRHYQSPATGVDKSACALGAVTASLAPSHVERGVIGSSTRRGTTCRESLRPVRMLTRAAMLAALLAAGCAGNKQRVSITTTPAGAEVLLHRRGVMDIDASLPVVGVSGSLDGGSFQDEFITLGNAPVEYEFELDDSDGSVSVRGQSVSVTKHYREGTIRVLMPGYRTIERLVAFSGSPVELHLRLEPDR